MLGLGKMIANLLQSEQVAHAQGAAGTLGLKTSDLGRGSSRLREMYDFGTNPGALRMFTHLPSCLADQSALVVILHGCAQTAAGSDHGAGWSTLADRYGFALLLPEQQRAIRPNGCFNWFQPGDTQRGQGEALSIRQMVDKMALDHGIDRSRVYVTGLSAGGAMASVMLATYPDVFAGGAIIAGLPYGAATNVQEAFESMFQSPARPAGVWGDLVRRASPHQGPWPRVSVWHGGMDTTVVPPNAAEIVKQWTDVHGLSATPTLQETVDGYPRQVWRNAEGDDLISLTLFPACPMAPRCRWEMPMTNAGLPARFYSRSAFRLPITLRTSGAWQKPPTTRRRIRHLSSAHHAGRTTSRATGRQGSRPLRPRLARRKLYPSISARL